MQKLDQEFLCGTGVPNTRPVAVAGRKSSSFQSSALRRFYTTKSKVYQRIISRLFSLSALICANQRLTTAAEVELPEALYATRGEGRTRVQRQKRK